MDDLRALMLAISRGESPIELGPKARTALDRIVDLQGDPALLTITALARKLDVNASTITRLARALGYPSFSAFQDVLLSASLSPPGAFYSRQAKAALESADDSSRAQFARLCRQNQANIDRLVDAFDAPAFDRAVSHIAEAPHVTVCGIRQFHAVAGFLVYGLRMIRSDVSLLDASNLGAIEEIAGLGPEDVLVSASCSPYSRAVVDVARAARERGLVQVAITDRASSPLVSTSSVALFAAHETSFLLNSLTAYMALAECLINGCATALGQDAADSLAERERLIGLMQVER